jgi:hypothetical protein
MPIPLIPAAQAGAGLLQTIFGGSKARKAQKELENMQSPLYRQNQSILDFYNNALARYNVAPTDTAMYKRNMQNIDRGVATGIAGLQDRRSALAGLPSILRAASDAKLNTEVAAEQEKSNRFSQLGGAAEMKAGEDRLAYQYNELAPFERKYNLKSMKAGAANQLANAGLTNIFGGLQGMGQMQTLDKIYGTGALGNKKKARSSRGTSSGVGYAPDFDNYGQPQ